MLGLSKIIVLGILLWLGFVYKAQIYDKYESLVNFSFCEKPIAYHIGTIDEKFNVKRETVISDLAAAANIWNGAYTSSLFVYDEGSNLDINLVFDERQRLTNTINQQQQTVKIQKVELDSKLSKYKEQYDSLNAAINELNKQIEYWNDKGGAPKDVYDKLVEKQKELNDQISSINKLAESVSQTTGTVNSKIDQLNQTINSFNSLLNTMPEEGIYVPQESKIDIYFYDSKNGFIHTAAHELGHALGLNHVMGDGAIMNPVVSDVAKISEVDKQELTTFCKEQDKVEYLIGNFKLIWQNFLRSIDTSKSTI